jgi:hypothetical protein
MIAGKCSERLGNDSLQMPSQAGVFSLQVSFQININLDELFRREATSPIFQRKSNNPKLHLVKKMEERYE